MKNRIEKENVQSILPLSSMQSSMLYCYLKNETDQPYYEQLTVTIEGEVKSDLFYKAWDIVAKQHEMLRVVFRWNNLSNPIQIVLKHKQTEINYSDTSKMDARNRLIYIEQQKKSEMKKIDLETEPFCVALYKSLESCQMILSFHHILLDGWSIGILIRDFVNVYCSLSNGNRISLSTTNSLQSYFNVLNKQQRLGEDAFWQQYLHGYDTLSVLPGDLKLYGENIIASYQYEFEEEIEAGLSAFSKKYHCTIATALYVAWGILLHKYSNYDDIVIGTTVSGRNIEWQGIDEMVGLFINTIPCRIQMKVEDTFESILKRTDSLLRERSEFENTPLFKIKENSSFRNGSSELFHSLIVVENYPLDNSLLKDINQIKVKSYSMTEKTNYELTIGIQYGIRTKISFHYNIKRYSNKYIKKISEYFNIIIGEILNLPDKKLSDLQLVRKNEYNRIVFRNNQTKMDYPDQASIYDIIVNSQNKSQNHTAVICEECKITYKELLELAGQISNFILNRSGGQKKVIGVLSDKSIEMVAAILGILKAGCAYLPLEKQYPENRITYMLTDSQVDILFVDELKSVPNEYDGITIELTKWDQFYKEPHTDIDVVLKASDTAYVIYTSGSTGTPKGVIIKHRSLANFLFSFRNIFERNLDSTDRCLSLTSISFDVSVAELFIPLCFNATLVLYTGDTYHLDKLTETIIEKSITLSYLPPSILQEVAAILGKKKGKVLLNKLWVGVEPIKASILKAFFKLNQEMKIINGYGPTETTICSTFYKFDSSIPDDENIPIGKPLKNTKVYVVDRHLNPVPFGAVGELMISGDGIAKGYINNSEITNKKFIENPFESNGLLYKTGDMVKYNENQDLIFLGRIDEQIKLRGYRIELKEIESVIRRNQKVRDCAVIVRGEGNDPHLCAYVTGEEELDLTELKEELKKELPDYMIPARMMQLARLPVTRNGKLDRRGLPEIILTGTKEEKAAQTEEEAVVIKAFEEILKVEQVGVQDHFFELGGHSLKMARLSNLLEEQTGVRVGLKEIMSEATPRGIAKWIAAEKGEKYERIEKAEEQESYPVSAAQRRLYFIQ
jgi:amino acid adenylation domain-containing protein